MDKFCSNCGKELEQDVKNCGKCGALVNVNKESNNSDNLKERYNPGFTIGLLSIPCGLFIAMSGWILGIVGIIINSNNRDKYDTKIGLILSIIGLVLSVVNSVIAVIINFNEYLFSLLK